MELYYNKSRMMRRAWEFFKNGTPSWGQYELSRHWCAAGNFSKAMEAAWAVEKYIVRLARQEAAGRGIFPKPTQRQLRRRARAAKRASEQFSADYHRGAAEYYANAPRGTYFGD